MINLIKIFNYLSINTWLNYFMWWLENTYRHNYFFGLKKINLFSQCRRKLNLLAERFIYFSKIIDFCLSKKKRYGRGFTIFFCWVWIKPINFQNYKSSIGRPLSWDVKTKRQVHQATPGLSVYLWLRPFNMKQLKSFAAFPKVVSLSNNVQSSHMYILLVELS